MNGLVLAICVAIWTFGVILIILGMKKTVRKPDDE